MGSDAYDTHEAADGEFGSAVKSVKTLTGCDATAYSASEGKKTPLSKLELGSVVRSLAPKTELSSYRAPRDVPLVTSPSTSNIVIVSRRKAGIGTVVPACTN